MAGKGRAKGTIKGPDVVSSVIVDTSNAERQLSGFITKLNKSNKQLTIDVGVDALKNAKQIWDAMASEMQKVGKSDIFNGMAESFEKANNAFKNMKVTLNGKELNGLVEVVKSLTSSDFDKISKIDFGISGIHNSVLEAKKLEEVTERIVKTEEKLAKTRKKSSRNSDVTEKLNKELASIKRRVNSVANLNLGFRVDIGSVDEISESLEKMQKWIAKLVGYREELENLKKTNNDVAEGMFSSIESAIASSLEDINRKIIDTTELLKSTKKNDADITKDIGENVKKLKEQINVNKELEDAQKKSAQTKLRTQEQVNAELDKEREKLKEIEAQQKENDAARERFKKKQENYGQEVLGVGHAVYDIDLLKGASKDLEEFNKLLETRNKYQEKYIKLCDIIEKYYLPRYGVDNGLYSDFDDFFNGMPDMKRLEKYFEAGQTTTNKEINALFKNVARSLQSDLSAVKTLLSSGEVQSDYIGQALDKEETDLNREMQSLLEAREEQLKKINALREEEISLIKQAGQEEAKAVAQQQKKAINMEAVIKRYNKLMSEIGHNYMTIGTRFSEGTENFNLADMVHEAKYWHEVFTGPDGGPYSNDPYDVKQWKSEVGKLSRFIKSYEPFIEGMEPNGLVERVISQPKQSTEEEKNKRRTELVSELDSIYNSDINYGLDELQAILEKRNAIVETLEKEKLITDEIRAKNEDIALDIGHDITLYQRANELIRQIGELGSITDVSDIDQSINLLKKRDDLFRQIPERAWLLPDTSKKIDSIAEENDILKQRIELLKAVGQSKVATYSLPIDEDELETIKKENGALEDKLELLWEIAEQYANTVTQKNREKYEELNQKDMDGGLTSRQEERFWELGEAIDEADRQIDEFGQTYERVILKLANGKKIEILPDDTGLRKFDKIANEYYGGEYNGIEIEDVIFERVQAVTGAILEQKEATEQLAEAHEKLTTKTKSSKVKVREFSNMDEYLAYQDKYRDDHDGENEYLEDVVDIVPRIGKDFAQISADMVTSCKKAETAVKRFFSAIDPNKYPELAEWKAGLEEAMENGVFALSDKQGGWAWEVQALDDNTYYINLVAVTDAIIDQTKATEKLAEARLKLSPKKDGNYTIPETYTALDGKYEVSKGKDGWDVYQRDSAGMYNLIGTYKTLNDVRNDASLLAREEIVVTSDITKEVETLAAAYEDMSIRAGHSTEFAEQYLKVFNEVRNGALSAADAIKQLNETISNKGLTAPVDNTASITKQLEDAYYDIDKKVDSLRGKLSTAEKELEKLEQHAELYGYTSNMSAQKAGLTYKNIKKSQRGANIDSVIRKLSDGTYKRIKQNDWGDYWAVNEEGRGTQLNKTQYGFVQYLMDAVTKLNVGWEEGLKILASQNGQLDAARQKVSQLTEELASAEKESELAYERMAYAHNGIFGDDNIAARKQQLSESGTAKSAEDNKEQELENIVQLVDNYGHELDNVNNKLMQGTKLLNEQGQILRLFHNSSNIFDAFDMAMAGSNQGQALGLGNYLALRQNGEFNDTTYGRYQTQWYANVQNAFDARSGKISSEQANSIIDKFLADRAEGFKQHMLSKLLDGDIVTAIKDIAEESKTVVGDIFSHIGYDAIKDGAQINIFDPSKIHRANDSVLDIESAEFASFKELRSQIWEQQGIIERANSQIKELSNQYSGQTAEDLDFALFTETLSKGWGWRTNVAKIASAFKELTGELPKSDEISEETMRKLVENYEFSKQNIKAYQDAVVEHEAILNELMPQFDAQKEKIDTITQSYLAGDISGVVNKQVVETPQAIEESADKIEEQIEATTKLTSSYQGLAAAVEQYVDSSKKLWSAYDKHEDFSKFAEDRNVAIKKIASFFPAGEYGISDYLEQSGYSMYLQSQESSRSYAQQGAEAMLADVEKHLGILEEERAAYKERQSKDEKLIVQRAEEAARAKKEQAKAAQEAAAAAERQAGAESKVSNNVSVEELIKRDMDNALAQLRSAKNNETTLFTLKGVFEGEDLVDQAQAMVENIAKQANLSLASFNVKDDTIKVKLYNDELKVTVDQMYKLRQATEDMESAQLELVSQSFTQNVKALNENNFDTEGIQQRALASIEKVRSSLHGLEYDLTDLENAARNISSQDDFTKFNNQLKATQDNIQAIKNATVSKNSMNPLANMQRDMQNASIEIETMHLKLEKFGDIQGVAEAKKMLEGMTAAAEQYNKAADAQDQQAAYNQYSNLRSSFKAQTEYINAAKALNESQKSTEKKTDPIREQYKSILDLINKINTKSAEITKYQNKDGGSGIFAGHISQLQAEKAKLVSELQGITDEINNALSGGFVRGKEVSVPFASILDGSGAISNFLNDTKTQASLTTEEIEKLVIALQKSQNLDINAATKAAEQFKSVQETYKRLSELTGIDQSNESYQALGGLYRQIVEYKNKLSADPMSWTPEESAYLQTLIDQFTKYGNKLAEVAEKEAKYFAGKTKYSQDTTMGTMTQNAAEEAQKLSDVQQKLEQAARKFAQESGAGDAFITNFTQGADGISKLDFSVFDTATGSLRNFRMEMGSVTEGMFVTETTISKSLANIQAAQKQLQSASGLLGKLDASGVSIDESTASVQVSKLLNLYKQLSAEIAKGDAADQNQITRLTSDLKMASGETEKFYKKMSQMEDAIANKQAIGLDKINPNGDIYGQLANKAQELASIHGNATLQLGAFDEKTNTLNASLVHANGTVEQFKVSMYGLGGECAAQQAGVTKLTSSWDQFKASLSKAGRQLMTALVGYNIFYKAISEVRKGIGYVKEIDLALTELKKVTDETEESYRNFLNTAAGMAGQIGSTVSDFTEASANFARLGYTMEESADMAKTAIVYKNVADGLDTVEESTDSIISTMKAFGIESNNTMQIIDVFNEVGNNFAITSAGIGEAMQRSASALYSAGNSFEESTALITAANSVIQNPEQVGTALKTLALRLRGAKVELEEAGLDVENMAESTSKLQDQLLALTHGKVNIMLDADTFKNTTQILREMSAVWEEMTDIEQAAALELMGGKRQANILSSLISNFETVEDVIETSMNSSGSAMAENEKWMDSVEGKSKKLANAMQALWNDTLNSDIIKTFYDIALGATQMVDSFGLIPSALAGVITYFAAFKKITPKSLFGDLATNIKNYAAAMQQVGQIKSLGFGMTDSGMLNVVSVKSYAAALSGMSAKQQAAILTSQGLEKAHIAQVLAQNGVEDATIRQIVGLNNLNAAKQASVAMTGAEIQATLAKQGVTLSDATTTWLADNATKELTRSEILKATATLMSKGATEQEIAALLGLAGASSTASLGIKGVTAALWTMMKSNPIGWIMMLISGVVMLATKMKQAKEETIKAAEQTVSAYKEAQNTLKEQKKTIDEVSASYERLSKGVDLDTNDNLSLTTESYQEYLNICNDIADMYPHLVTGYDAQGNAILSLKGNVDQLTQAYRDSAQAARQQMIAGGSDVFDIFKSNYSNDASTTLDNVGLEQKIKLAEEIQRLINEGTEDEINAFFDNLSAGNVELDGQKYSNVEMVKLFEDAGIKVGWNNMPEFMSSWDGSVDIEKFKQQSTKLLSFITSATTQINTETSKVKSLMDAYLGEDFDYAKLGNKSKAMINQIVSGLSAEFISGFDSADALYNWIKTNVVDAFKDPSVVDAINELSNLQFKFAEGDISYSDYTTQLEEHISKIKNKFDDKTLAQIKVGIGIDEKSLITNSNHIKTLLNSTVTDVDNKINSLSIEDLQIAGQLEVPSDTLYSWEELIEKIETAKIAATKDFDITNYTDAITAHSAAITEYQEALQSLDKGSFTMNDFMDLIKKYPELAKGVDISSNAFHGLSRNLKGAIKTSTKNFVKDLKELRVQLVAAGKSTDSIDQLIDAINNMPDDALGGIIKQYSTLTDKIEAARRAQDKLLASMDENPNEGYETRGEAMDYMKEAMKKGEIGSESNLWNVAEKYGFTYDSAKTINENADALAKYIAIREKWFQEEDDGDDRTNDGYSYKGTESFIKDVESAVKKSAELQQLLTWDYNETTGTLNFDYDNKDWDAIVSILSKTKELAGLTSDEFADMMIQIGQYFGIDWGNYNDVLDHLNEIASGSSDAKTKVEEYGQAMQEYFGEDTTIDLTARPMVKFDSTNFKEWEKLYQEIISNPEGHSEADVKNAKEQLEAIKRGTDVATVYTSTYTSDDGNKSIVVTPILPDGRVLSPGELEEYANKLLAGEEIDPDINIKLAEFDGANSVKMADEYAQALHEAQAQYDLLRDTLSINTTIDEKGIEGLKEIKEVQNSIKTNADGTVIINEDTFREALEGAQYTEDQIDLIIEKIKKLNSNAFIKFNVSDALETKGIDGLKEINELQGAIKEDADTGLTILDTDMFTSVLEEAGYTKDQIQQLIDKIKEYQGIVAVSGNTDPLGLNNASLSIDSLKASLSTLDVSFSTGLGKWFDGKTDLNINVQDMVSALKAKGWTDEAIKEYMTQLANTNIDGFRIDVKTDQIDEALEKASEVPEEKETDYEVVGAGVKTLEDIDTYWDSVTKDKTTNYTIYETTVKKTKGSFWDSLFGSDDDDDTEYKNKRGGSGTVFAGGTSGAPRTETALVGELGPELLVRNGRWTTIGDNGAEFTQVKKGDIIFNHRQTEELLKNGYVTGRGKAYASGTAYATGDGTFGRYEFSGSGGYQEYNVNDTVVESWGDLSGMIEEAKDSAKDAADEFAETFDWIEIRLEEINNQMDILEAKVENAASASDKNALIDEMLALNETKLKNLKAGAEAYEAYANTLFNKIPSQYQEMARDGSISITQFAGEADEATVEAIENYREWEQKAADLNLQIEELKKNNADLAKEKFDNVAEEYDSQIDLIDKQNDKIDAQIDLMESRGYVASEAYYNALIGGTVSKGAKLLEERAELQKKLDEGVQSGDITKGGTDYNELVAQIYDVDLAIMECTADIEEYRNAINDIKWDNFDELIDRIDYLSDETQNLIDLMENSGDIVDENGNWTDEGITSLGLYAQQMEIAEYRARQYEEAINELNKGYKMGLYSESEYQEKLNELKDAQYDSIEAYYEAQDAIVDLNKTRVDAIKDGIEKEIDAYEELINKKKEELDAEKDLHDFQKSTMEQQKNVVDIQRKLAALSSDNSASAVAQRKQLEAELAEAQTELDDTYYNRSIEQQKEALDRELEDFQNQKDAEIQIWEEYLTNVEQVVADSLFTVQTNADTVYSTLNTKADEYNLHLSDSILTPWRNGAFAIDGYQEHFDTAMSSTTNQLELVKLKWQEIIALMDVAAAKEIKVQQETKAKTESVTYKPPQTTNKPPQATNNTPDKKPNQAQPKKTIAVGGKINAGSAKIYSDSYGGGASSQYYSKDPVYVVLQERNGYLLVRHHSKSSGYTGWFKKSDVKAYAKGTKKLKKSGIVNVDELGEELILGAKNGRLTYLEKDSGIIPADITSNLMSWGELNPQAVLDRNRPSIGASPSVVNNTTEINLNIKEVVHVDTVTNDTIPNLTKAIDKQLDSYMVKLNNAIKAKVR